MELKGKTALVTGASSGLGEAFARHLAARGANLVITARRTERLESLAKELDEKHQVKTTVVALDLGKTGSPNELFQKTEGAGSTIDVVINNAGFGTQDRFVDIPWERTAEQIQLNVGSVVELTWLFARAMSARKGGHILNVASIGAYTPSPDYAAYSASKAFVRDFTEAVAYEMKGTGVRLCSLCPGLTATEFHKVAGHKLPASMKMVTMSAERCARIGLDALFAGRRNIVPGWYNKLQMFLLRFMPRRWMVASASMAVGRRRALPPAS
jgi:short-subunit dehydrogenase